MPATLPEPQTESEWNAAYAADPMPHTCTECGYPLIRGAVHVSLGVWLCHPCTEPRQ